MPDSSKTGIIFGEYLRLLPLMKKYPHLTMRDVIDLNKKYPDHSIDELSRIVEATNTQ